MSTEAQTVLREALSLPHDERAGIAEELLASLEDTAMDDPGVTRELWRQEIERRARRVLAGGSDGENWDSLRRRLANEFAEG